MAFLPAVGRPCLDGLEIYWHRASCQALREDSRPHWARRVGAGCSIAASHWETCAVLEAVDDSHPERPGGPMAVYCLWVQQCLLQLGVAVWPNYKGDTARPADLNRR